MKKILKWIWKWYCDTIYAQIALKIGIGYLLWEIMGNFWLALGVLIIVTATVPLYRLWKQRELLILTAQAQMAAIDAAKQFKKMKKEDNTKDESEIIDISRNDNRN